MWGTMRASGILILLTATLAVPLLEADERGALTLYFLQLPVGEEAYQVTTEANGSLTLRASFEYTERGSRVPLSATLRMKPDLTPLQFEAKGKSYRPFSVDAAVQVNPDGRTATVREGDKTRQATLPARFFTISGYAPFSVQMMLLRYWAGHGKPARLTQLPAEAPGTEALIEVTGQDTIDDDGKPVRLTRYSVGNVVWGNETIWLNENGQIAGGVSYAGGLPLEAIRTEYRLAFPQLIRSAVADRLKELAAAGSRIQPLVKGEFAIAGATLIDGTGATPVPDAVVVVKDGRIAAAHTVSSDRAKGNAGDRWQRRYAVARPVGDARAFRAGGVGPCLSGRRSYHSAGLRRRIRVHHLGSRSSEWCARQARYSCRPPKPIVFSPYDGTGCCRQNSRDYPAPKRKSAWQCAWERPRYGDGAWALDGEDIGESSAPRPSGLCR
jgi:hypothetical protein